MELRVIVELGPEFIRAVDKLSGGGVVLTAIENLHRKVDELMATQEARLQAISTKIDEVLADLQTLRENNPQIEDEIAAIEAKLSLSQAPPVTPPAPPAPPTPPEG